MDALRDMWESIPNWVVFVVVAVIAVGAYFLFQYLHLPSWMFWAFLACIGGGVLFGLVNGFFSGGF